jgi:hypothetical protein
LDLLNKIWEALEDSQYKDCISEIAERSSDDSFILHIPIDRVSESAKEGYISRIQLEKLLKNLNEKFSHKFDFLHVESEKLNNLVKGIDLILKAEFGDFIEDINFTFLSAEKINLEIYIQNLDADTQSNLDKFIISVFETSNIQVANIEWIGEIEEYPSVMEILIALKETQPISLENLNSKLRLTDPKWLNRQLDKLIKKSLLVRDNSSKQYALTGKGLGIIPNITNNSNSDIKRALSLGYRKW